MADVVQSRQSEDLLRGFPAKSDASSEDTLVMLPSRTSPSDGFAGRRFALEELVRQAPALLLQTRGVPDSGRFEVSYISPRCAEFLGRQAEEVIARPQLLLDAIHPEDRGLYQAQTLAATTQTSPFNLELRVVSTNGVLRWMSIHAAPTRLPSGEVQIDAVVLDVTQRKLERRLEHSHSSDDSEVRRRAEQLTASEQRFRQLAESVEETFWISTPDKSETIYVSPAYERTFGRTCQSLYADPKSFLEGIHPDDRQRVRDALPQQALGSFEQEYRFIRPDGTLRWIWSRAFPIHNDKGEVYRVAGIAQDITKRKLAEQKLKAEERLSRKLLDLQERERQLIAHDIHDGFVQDVTGAKMLLEGLRHRIENRGNYRPEELRVIEDLLSKAIREGRRLIGDLRPLIIDEEGVIEAINYLVAENCSKGSVAIAFEHAVQFQRLPPLLEGTIFRIVQEALTNIRRHSKAKQAEIRFREREGYLRIEIHDNGVGFDLARMPEDRFGVRGIAERARLFGGTARIDTGLGRGTHIYVKLPIGDATLA